MSQSTQTTAQILSTTATVTTQESYSTINGDDGEDTINGYYYSSSMNGGTGNDTIYGNSLSSGDLYQYAAGDGNDIIYNISLNDTLSISGADYNVENLNNDLLVSVEDSGTISLIGAANKNIYICPVKSGGQGNYKNNSANDTLLTGSGYADTIKNSGSNVTITAGADNDSIDGNTDFITVATGAGNQRRFLQNQRFKARCKKINLRGENFKSALQKWRADFFGDKTCAVPHKNSFF